MYLSSSFQKKIKFKDNQAENDNVDSGIEEKEGIQELDELISIIKTEEPVLYAEAINPKKLKRSENINSDSPLPKESDKSPTKKTSKKRKSSTSLPASVTTDSSEDVATLLTPKKIKKEKVKSEDEQTPENKVKKEKSSKKKTKNKLSLEEVEEVHIKPEVSDVDD